MDLRLFGFSPAESSGAGSEAWTTAHHLASAFQGVGEGVSGAYLGQIRSHPPPDADCLLTATAAASEAAASHQLQPC